MKEDIKKLITEAKNICVIPSQGTSLHPASQNSEPESLTAALALFYTLKEMGKNVNLIAEEFPGTLQFLVPPLDYISSPKNFVISIPKNVAEISQIYYEKHEENVKIHVTMDKGRIKKEDIAFYYENAKPDVIITVGIQDFQKTLEGKLDSFGFLLGSPVINIDNRAENLKFGQVNMVEDNSLPQITMGVIKIIGAGAVGAPAANCLLAGLILHYENFQNPATAPEVFELCAALMKQGADRKNILGHIYAPPAKGAFAMQESAAENPQ